MSVSPLQVKNNGIGNDFDRFLWFKALEFNAYAAMHMREASASTERLSEQVERILDDIASGKEKVARYDNVNEYLKHLDDESND